MVSMSGLGVPVQVVGTFASPGRKGVAIEIDDQQSSQCPARVGHPIAQRGCTPHQRLKQFVGGPIEGVHAEPDERPRSGEALAALERRTSAKQRQHEEEEEMQQLVPAADRDCQATQRHVCRHEYRRPIAQPDPGELSRTTGGAR